MKKPYFSKAERGMTIVETMVAATAGTIVLAAVTFSMVALQRSYAAVENYSTAEGDQMRVSDYMALDVRRASSATVTNGVLVLTIPDYYDGSGNARNPVFANSVITYGTTPVTVRYYRQDTNFIREVNGVATVIASNVSTFNVVPLDLSANISWTITFAPTFTTTPSADAIAGSATFSSTFLRNACARQ